METATTIQETKIIGIREKLLAFLELTKPRIAFMLVLIAGAGFYLGSANGFNFVLFLNSMIGITLLAFGVATLNQVIERRSDALMLRTAGRPLPTNKVSFSEALIFGIILTASSIIYLAILVNFLTAVLGLIVFVGYVLFYTPLKKISSTSTAIGAIPGAMPPLMGWTSAANEITLSAWILFTILFLWQFPHFLAIAWMYREQYANAGIKMLPVVEPSGANTFLQIISFTLMLLLVSIIPYILGLSGIIYLIGAVILGVWFLAAGIQSARFRSIETARKLLIVSVLYLPLVFLLMMFNRL